MGTRHWARDLSVPDAFQIMLLHNSQLIMRLRCTVIIVEDALKENP